MAGRDSRHAEEPGRRRGGSWLVALVVVLLLAAGGLAWQAGLLEDLTAPDPATEPEAVPPPPGLELPEPGDPGPVVRPLDARDAGSVAPAAVRRTWAPRLRDRKDLGRRGVGAVAGLAGGPVTRVGAAGRITPASTTKLLTATAALQVLGPEATFTTTAASGPGNWLTLVGGGDPFLARLPAPDGATYPPRADLRTLARRTARALTNQGLRRVRLGWDASLFAGPSASEGWRADYLPDDVVAPIGALWVDEGRPADGSGRVDDPARVAAQAFAAELRGAGLRVAGAPRPRERAAAAEEVAAVTSAPLSQVVERVLEVSDNEAAEVLGHHVGLATGNGGSFAGGAAGTVAALRELGVPVGGLRLFDGSGLSRRNRARPETLIAVLQRAARQDRPELRPVLTGLPVAGFTGSLADRFGAGDAAGPGAVRAKTGTLTGVHALAGLVTTRDGSTLAFVLSADRVPGPKSFSAQLALDEAAAALAACACGREAG